MVQTSVLGERPGRRGARAPIVSPGAGERPEPRQARVLIVEDDAIIAMAVAEELRENGFVVVGPADNGPSAIELAAQHRPDLIIVDVRLRGEMDGIVAARHIRERLSTRVVFASAHIDAATRGAMEAVGYNVIVAKPYTPEQIVRAVQTALRDRST